MTAELRERVVQRYIAEPSLPNRNAVVMAHRYLCRRGARKFYRGTVDRADLEQIAAIGLIKASQRYSRAYDTPFEAYAWLIIVGELMHFVRDHEHIVRIPRTLRCLDLRYSHAYERLSAENEREPSASDLAAAMDVPLSVVDEIRALRSRNVAADRDDDDAAASGRLESLPSRHQEYAVEDRLTVTSALRTLSDRDLRIVRAVFVEEHTQFEVGRELGLSQRQVSRLLGRILAQLRGRCAEVCTRDGRALEAI